MDDSCNLQAIDTVAINLIGRSTGDNPQILSIYDHVPKEPNKIETLPCKIDCLQLKKEIKKELFMRVPLSDLHQIKLGTLLRQYFNLKWDGIDLSLNLSCENCNEIAQIICLQIGHISCKGGQVNMTSIMESMKILFHLATSKDFRLQSQKLLDAGFKWSTVELDEVIFSL